MRIRAPHVLAGAAAALLLLPPGPAAANTFGVDGAGLYHADNAEHTFHYVGLTAEFNSSMNWARVDALGNDTDMTQRYSSTRDNQIDVVAFDERYSENFLGAARCVRLVTSSQCDQWEVFLNIRMFDGRTQNERTKTAVHEVGHTVGLGHSSESTSPMQQGYFSIIRYSTGHDRPHLNGRY